jgi:uncharacterized SAM-binding protein YcdF (DUF218 family)
VIRIVARALGAPLALRDPLAPLDAIVVLGATLLPDGRASDVVAERARAAAALYHAGGAPIVCATGLDHRGHSEAAAIASILIAAGVPASALRLDHLARSTRENALRARALLPDARAVWVVTQPFHARRARWHFRRAGFDPRIWHIADSLQYRHPARALRWIAREYAALVANRLR